jgi:hypothetical protein
MAADFGPRGIGVNAIAPGEIDTPILSPGTEKIVAQIPLHRLGTPDEVGKIIYVLCTDTSSYLNGAEIHIKRRTARVAPDHSFHPPEGAAPDPGRGHPGHHLGTTGDFSRNRHAERAASRTARCYSVEPLNPNVANCALYYINRYKIKKTEPYRQGSAIFCADGLNAAASASRYFDACALSASISASVRSVIAPILLLR